MTRKWGLTMLAAVFALSGCCTSDKCIAVTASNMMHDAGVSAAESIRIGCTERYKLANTQEQIAALDPQCLPAATAYSTFAKAQAYLQAVIAAMLAGDPGASLSSAMTQAKSAALTLAQKVQKVPQ